MTKLVQALETLEQAPISPLSEALTTLSGGEIENLEPDDDLMIVRWATDGSIQICFPQINVLSPGLLERTTPMMYRRMQMARAGVKERDLRDAEEDAGAPLVGPLEGTNEEAFSTASGEDDPELNLEDDDE